MKVFQFLCFVKVQMSSDINLSPTKSFAEYATLKAIGKSKGKLQRYILLNLSEPDVTIDVLATKNSCRSNRLPNSQK